jgi:membrane protein required for colicin V production
MVSGMTLNDISTFDCIIALILLIFLIRGLCTGFVRQLAAALTLAGSYWLADRYIGLVMPYAEKFVNQPGAVFLISFGVLFLSANLLITLIGSLLHRYMEASLLGWVNRFAGGLLSLSQGAVLVTLAHMALASILPPSHLFFQDSLTAPWLGKGAEIIRQRIQDAEVRNDLRPERDSEKKPPLGEGDGTGSVMIEFIQPELRGFRP